MRTAPLGITMSPMDTLGEVEAQLPTRIMVSAPLWCSSSTAMAVEGPPIPVLVTATGTPSRVPVQVRYSRL